MCQGKLIVTKNITERTRKTPSEPLEIPNLYKNYIFCPRCQLIVNMYQGKLIVTKIITESTRRTPSEPLEIPHLYKNYIF